MGIQQKTINRKQYSSEFKREAVRLVTEGGLSMAQVARDLGLNDNMVSRWKKEAEQNGQRAFPGQGHPQDEELSRLRREVEVSAPGEGDSKKSHQHLLGSRTGNQGDALSIHPGASGSVSQHHPVSHAGRLCQCLLSVAKATSQPARLSKNST